jgi:glycosyltransferase involved in cell wall biosynthesis
MIFVSTTRDSSLKTEFGGTPYSLIQGIRECGYQSSGVNLAPFWLLHVARFLWRLWRVVNLKSPFGWQYSAASSWARGRILNSRLVPGDSLISFFQIVPRISAPYVIYTDCSLKFIFEHYPESLRVPQDIREKAIKLEVDTYNKANLVFLKTEEAIKDLNLNYKIPLDKLILQIVPPNNSFLVSKDIVISRQFQIDHEICFVFIGKDGLRKGLDRAIEVIRYLQSNGLNCRLDVIGTFEFQQSTVALEKVFFHGKLELGSSLLLSILKQSHFGFLLSRSEAAGISLMEFQAAGVIPIVSSFPGSFQSLKCRNFIQLDSSESIESLAIRVLNYLRSPDLKMRLAQAGEDAVHIPNWHIRAQELIALSDFQKT